VAGGSKNGCVNRISMRWDAAGCFSAACAVALGSPIARRHAPITFAGEGTLA
jgi:hypothetical protein